MRLKPLKMLNLLIMLILAQDFWADPSLPSWGEIQQIQHFEGFGAVTG